jgi:hypothetical protein
MFDHVSVVSLSGGPESAGFMDKTVWVILVMVLVIPHTCRVAGSIH